MKLCKLGIHKKELLRTEQTIEVDSETGMHLIRNVYECKSCHKIIYNRIDGIISISNKASKNWMWKAC